MKVKSSVSKRCISCKIIKRNKSVYIYCKKFKKHNQKQG